MYDRAGMPMKKPKGGDNSEGVPQGGSLWNKKIHDQKRSTL
jgi:hypothetical protein